MKSKDRARTPYEFTQATKLEALRRAHWKCECCGRSKERVGYLEIHHKLGIAIALRKHPEIGRELLRSIANAEVLCPECHDLRDIEDRKNHAMLAQALLGFARQPALV